MRLLLDENLPESLAQALRDLGHEVDTVNSLSLKGIDNGRLYREVAHAYDICFTRDAGFVHNVRQAAAPSSARLLRVTLPQQPAKLFVEAFVDAFRRADWSRYRNGDDWP